MKRLFKLMIFLVFIGLNLSGNDIPEKPNPPRLVNDFAGILNKQEVQALEAKLNDFNNRTTTQIVIITLKTLDGYDKAQYATEIGHKWGVGQKGSDNGIIVLIKEKTQLSRGEAFIAVGYGLEGVIPDATAKQIIENEMIPSFKQNNYFEGVDKAVNTIMKLSLGEFSAKEYNERTSKKENPFGALFGVLIFLFVLVNLFGRSRTIQKRSIGKNIPFWIALGMLGSGVSRHGGSWGNFSSGGGSSGGFGGFGGGGFGGGGAGGSW
jgi:uncharacterized protein